MSDRKGRRRRLKLSHMAHILSLIGGIGGVTIHPVTTPYGKYGHGPFRPVPEVCRPSMGVRRL